MNNNRQTETGSSDLVKTEIGRINKCECCGTYYIDVGFLTIKMNRKELHSLFYMLLKALKLEKQKFKENH